MNNRKKSLIYFFTVFFTTLAYEMILRYSTIAAPFGKDNMLHLALIIIMSAIISAFISTISSLFTLRIGRRVLTVIIGIGGIFFASQIVYHKIFRTFYVVNSIFHGAQAMEFQSIIIDTILNRWPQILLIILAAVLAIRTLYKIKAPEGAWGETVSVRKDKALRGTDPKTLLVTFLSVIVLLSSGIAVVAYQGKTIGTPYFYLFTGKEYKGSIENFGYVSATILDAKRLLERESKYKDGYVPTVDIIEDIDSYFDNKEPLLPNKYSGLFQGKNLIFITAESFSDYAINPEYTPTLYKLQNQGFNFTNYYNPVWGVSTLDGEYVNQLSLLPEAGIWSMYKAANHYLPYSLGNIFKRNEYVTKGYHNHSINYYDRVKSHPNIGYDFDGQGGSFKFKRSWPESDLEMVEKTTGEFLTEREGVLYPFLTYYLTVSAHMEYSFENNDMSKKNQDAVKDMDVSDTCKAYMAANVELDKAVELLIKRLTEARALDKTVIVIAGDHYPYALSDEEIQELRGKEFDNEKDRYKSSLIIWTPNMKPITIDKVGSNLDILPTLANLFGFQQAGRYMMGSDLLANTEGIAVFDDYTWISDKGSREELSQSEASEDAFYVQGTDRMVIDKFKYSDLILDNDYFRFSEMAYIE